MESGRPRDEAGKGDRGFWEKAFCLLLRNPAPALMIITLLVALGLFTAPFDWDLGGAPRSPVPVDAIPDIGENQQIVFTQWEGRSPRDVEDQITFPLTSALLGLPGVKTVRSTSMFGISSIYVIFRDDVDFYWARSRILEKLSSLPQGSLPPDAQPALGPDATGMGQIFWYTLEALDREGRPAGGWDLHEIRTCQDWFVRYALLSVEGVSEVASVGGFVKEYQIDLDPDLMRIYDVTIPQVVQAVRNMNPDVGARTIEINSVEYIVRGLGFIREKEDIENEVIKLFGGVPVRVSHVARVSIGPSLRQGVLDKQGREVVGGVVVMRYGENPMKVIEGIRKKIIEISPGLPARNLTDGSASKLTLVPFYDRGLLVRETLGTLENALTSEILITVLVVMVLMRNIAGSLLVASLLPISVLLCFIPMKLFGVDANIVALAGIAIAIGTMVDTGIVVMESIVSRLSDRREDESLMDSMVSALRSVAGPVTTAVATTVIGFLPVFALGGAEGKLFTPLAFTKTAALVSALFTATVILPTAAVVLSRLFLKDQPRGVLVWEILGYGGAAAFFFFDRKAGAVLMAVSGYNMLAYFARGRLKTFLGSSSKGIMLAAVFYLLTAQWMPLGHEEGIWKNLLFACLIMAPLLLGLFAFVRYYRQVLSWCLKHKAFFLTAPSAMLVLAFTVWLGFQPVWGWLPALLTKSKAGVWLAEAMPGLQREFMPALDEGAFLFMPSTMPHASIAEVEDILRKQDIAIAGLPEVKTVVGKLGRAETALDPAPVSMIETLVEYHPCFVLDEAGRPMRFRFLPSELDLVRDPDGRPLAAPDGKPYLQRGMFKRDDRFRLIPDPEGKPFRLWRPPLDPKVNPGRRAWKGIRSPDDIWDQIVKAARIPGVTSPSRLQPISARMVMLQSGIRSKMGIRVAGPDLASVDKAAKAVEELVRRVGVVEPETVVGDRLEGKPYLEIRVRKDAAAQYGVNTRQVLDAVEYAIGGKRILYSVEGRERYPVRVRYQREHRDDMEKLGGILVATAGGAQVPLIQLAEILYVRGPSAIRAENTFLTSYVLFDGKPGYSETTVVEQVDQYLREALEAGNLSLPPAVSYSFTGVYEGQLRAEKTLTVIIPAAVFIIFLILYLQLRSLLTCTMVFSGIFVAWSGGLIMIWLYGKEWFMDITFMGYAFRDVFQIHPINLSVAVWVGFLALFGIASDDGVIMASYLMEGFRGKDHRSVPEVRATVIEGAMRRVRPCIMTTATTILALLPVLSSRGRGSDLMIPMAIPTFGGMVFEVVTMLILPVLYCLREERRLVLPYPPANPA